MRYKCKNCGLLGNQRNVNVLKGRARFCSKKCQGEYRTKYYIGKRNPFFGRRHTEASKKLMSEKKKGQRNSIATEFKKGQKPMSWKGGRYNFLKSECLKRDNNTCQVCFLFDPEIMQVDHIKPRVLHPELYNSLDNLRAICPNCHERKSRIEKGINPFRIGNPAKPHVK